MAKPRVKIRVTGELRDGLVGYVNEHPKWPGEAEHGPVWTSPIIARHPNGDIETENTIYEVVS
jgi:hypothetical protein